MENTKRNIVHVIVQNPDGTKFIALKSKKFDWLTPVTGGVEEGEIVEEAALREIREETGYQNVVLEKKMPFRLNAEFYAAHKKVNRSVFSDFLFYKLVDLEQKPLAEEEAALHDLVWLPMSDIKTLHPVGELPYILAWMNSGNAVYTGNGTMLNSGAFDGLANEEVVDEILKSINGRKKVTYKLRDWVFSRQRYWGEPIPLIHCAKDGWVAVPDTELPVRLPEVEKYEPTDNGESPLSTIDSFVNTTCPECGGAAKRETDTMPNWAGSSWYFLRYIDPKNDQAFA